MSAIEPFGLHSTKEELGPVGVRAGVSHAQDAGAGVLESEVLISKLGTIDGLATSAVLVGEIATLAHEVGDDAMERGACVTETLFAGAQGTEVFSSLGHNIATEFNDNPTERLAICGDVEETAGKCSAHNDLSFGKGSINDVIRKFQISKRERSVHSIAKVPFGKSVICSVRLGG